MKVQQTEVLLRLIWMQLAGKWDYVVSNFQIFQKKIAAISRFL